MNEQTDGFHTVPSTRFGEISIWAPCTEASGEGAGESPRRAETADATREVRDGMGRERLRVSEPKDTTTAVLALGAEDSHRGSSNYLV